ncbi:unnamed protein product [Vitrella brassicaformis CCMP3155]|uniref:Uncharacterized protein n=2 Tax=Vitrella brassicaformis TaxID=1169539 RepID=A0A0G4H5H8_VITBC|nr:unnamed protein product [Vitrella brassicaformis CCMP3155]|eukprot:CEM39033.1 unnamed protein product [Vitrella brassicaformis CCMP3155]
MDEVEAFLERRVFKWKATKMCTVCKKEIVRGLVEPVEYSCPTLWRLYHGYVMLKRNCPNQTHVSVVKVSDLRSEERHQVWKMILQHKKQHKQSNQSDSSGG